jgi:hypothetical protein
MEWGEVVGFASNDPPPCSQGVKWKLRSFLDGFLTTDNTHKLETGVGSDDWNDVRISSAILPR